MLEVTTAEIEMHVGAGGWDQPPVLFALVTAGQFRADEPDAAARLGLDAVAADVLTPIEQEALPEGALDEALAGISWPDSVVGCALSQEIVILPPGAEEGLGEDDIAARAATHPDRREARLVVVVLRDGSSASVLRLRVPADPVDSAGTDGAGAAADPGDAADLLTGPDLAPNLVAALLATLR